MYQTTNYIFSCSSVILSVFCFIYTLALSYKHKETTYKSLFVFSILLCAYVIYCSFITFEIKENTTYLPLFTFILVIFWWIVIFIIKNHNKSYITSNELDNIYSSSKSEEEYIHRKIANLSKLKIDLTIPESNNNIYDIYNIPKTSPILIVGFKDSGKTTIGKIISAKLGRTFIDTDNLLIKEIGTQYSSIKQFIKQNGHNKYLEIETRCLTSALNAIKKDAIVALGGGTADNIAVMNIINNYGTVVYLDVNRNELYNKINKEGKIPMFIDPKNKIYSFNTIYNRRSETYKKSANICVKLSTFTKAEKNACDVLSALERYFKNDALNKS